MNHLQAHRNSPMTPYCLLKKRPLINTKKLKLRPQKLKWIIYSINTDIEAQPVVELFKTGNKKKTVLDLCKALDTDIHSCRYVLYDHEYTTHDGRIEDKIYFITWVPPASSSRSKILFAKEKPNMEKMFDGGVLCFQASSTSELKSKFTDESDSESSEWDPDA